MNAGTAAAGWESRDTRGPAPGFPGTPWRSGAGWASLVDVAGKALLVLLATVVTVEVVVILGLGVALFLLGAGATIAFGAGMLIVSLVACVLAVVVVRRAR